MQAFGELPLGIDHVVSHVDPSVDGVGEGGFSVPVGGERVHEDVDVVVPCVGGGAEFFVASLVGLACCIRGAHDSVGIQP